eukprot:TRINITY_DN3852_c0_g1_i1.p1 TRINITY_DN3852_c0_g1~~TRINITY_DN3852_c0_g1_i1.p1  ORF type:complete len:2026 (+),score=365.24 TRINITY_DN3852_c0_g1_i1:79-6078(+)
MRSVRQLLILVGSLVSPAQASCENGAQRFFFSNVAHNNLGGAGPDQDGSNDLIFNKVTNFNGRCVELQVGAAPGAPYTAQNANQNGAATDEYLGRVNVMSGTSASLVFTLRDCETKKKVELPHFNLTFYALNVPKKRSVTVTGYRAAFQASEGLFDKEYTNDGTVFSAARPCDSSLRSGDCGLTFYFQEASEVPVTLSVPGVRGFGDLFYFSASICNSIRVPYGKCVAGVCGEGFVLKANSLGKECYGPVCEESECCQLREDRISYPLVESCHGRERSWRTCQDLPECHPCLPIDCVFHPWSEWTGVGGCSGLCQRFRLPGQNNECGNPCSGPTRETIVRLDDPTCYPPSCEHKNRDCVWGQWNEWTQCHKGCEPCMLGQRFRSRQIYLPELGDGLPCAGPWNATEPCEANHARDCVLSQWAEWTGCSKKCGGGWQARMRRIIQEARFGGKSCGIDEFYNQGLSTRQTQPCNQHACGSSVPCVLSDWSEWEGCHHVSPYQKYRFRDILQTEMNGGKPCDMDLNETAGCPEPEVDKPKPPCYFSDWDEWSDCSATCGGQKHRSRRIEGEPCVLHGQASRTGAALKETMACGHRECSFHSCRLSEWSDWTQCSSECGIGATSRSRKILEIGDTLGCNTALEEVKACSLRICEGIDCVWGEWDEWGACTCSCNGGIKRRNRVIAVAPRRGGRLCSPMDKNEVVPCNTQSCDACVDGEWGAWGEWGDCSSDCSPSFRVRHRNVAQHPNACGKAASGLEDEYEVCQNLPKCVPDQDCQLSSWGEWSDCSCKCFGVRERQRNVAQYARGNGRTCATMSLKEVHPCNPSVGESPPADCEPDDPTPCVVGAWSEWSECTKTCEGGQMNRMRHILSPAANGGALCSQELSMTAPCNTQSCEQEHCVDCVWGSWSEWSDCTKCGGQRFRNRNIIRLPNKCGKPCDEKAAKELGSCESHCEKEFYCVWSGWEAMGACSKTCGSGTRMRQRHLSLVDEKPFAQGSIFFVATADSTCNGQQVDSETCEQAPCETCVPQDCIFNTWSTWSAPTCTQLCERHRTVAQESHCGGKFCDGKLLETKPCPHDCSQKRDCVFGDWSEWHGDCDTSNGQRMRRRAIAEPAMNGGEQCEGDAVQTEPCGGVEKEDCQMAPWSGWGSCSVHCDGGIKYRSRKIAVNSKGGGEPCTDSLSEVRQCNMHRCNHNSRDCIMGAWSGWTSCQDASMKFRFRRIVQQPANFGKTCQGSLREAASCLSRVDCVVSSWTHWDACDKTCGGGQRTRQRQVTTNPTNGGKVCPEILIETQGCNAVPCQTRDCVVSGWHEWGMCSATCGMGYRTRSRDFQQRPCPGGRGCDLDLAQAQPCHEAPCGCVDCLWDEWSEWSECDKDCDGGQTVRSRKILRKPLPGCKACDALESEEVKPCNTQPCSTRVCVDGQWDDWQEWGVCSSTCEGGESWRYRKVRVEANECGVSAPGLDHEAQKCNVGIPCVPSEDCLFSDWGSWSDCSGKCQGVRERKRTIAVPGKGNGLYCSGALSQTAPCHNGGGLLDFSDRTCYLDLSRIKNNNLGGQGPWGVGGGEGASFAPTMRFRNVAELPSPGCPYPSEGSCNGRMVDLEIRTSDDYQVCDVSHNGRFGEGFGEINVAAGSSVRLHFRLVDSLTDERVHPKRLMLKIYGLTQGHEGGADMSVFAANFKDYYLPKDTTIAVSADATGAVFQASGSSDSGFADMLQFAYSADGRQESRAVAILFEEGSDVDVTFQVSPGSTCRKFYFAAKSCFGAGSSCCEVDPCHMWSKPPVDCVMSEWHAWGPCDAQCGVGQQTRMRSIVQQPAKGGFGCTSDLSQTRECIDKPCHDECTPVDCLWTQWLEWGACDRCGGQMKRVRHIASHPQCGGMACKRGAAEQITNCTRSCRDKTFCVWNPWGDYGPCTATCGAGLQSRERRLHPVAQIPGYGYASQYTETDGVGMDFQMKFEELHARTQKMESSRTQVLVLAFTAGSFSLAAVFGVVRVFSSRRSL